MRKVKFTQTTINEKLSAIVDGFPKLDDIHPFYADLMNVLYDKDHFKLALGHLNKAKKIVDNIANDYVRMLKYGDSLYRCKMVKRAALGRMATLLKKLKASLGYLEEVRKHMSRLPTIDTQTRTLIITGYPNVGKSSFMNKITKANVDVQNYAFTTQSLFVGHTNFSNTDWQVIDTPGLLDRPISERNTIEMQAITALAHLNSCVLFFIDISETCGYTIDSQIALFESIKPLFQGKPLVIALTKIDIQPFDQLDKEVQDRLQALAKDNKAYLLHMSNENGDGIPDVKKTACEILLDHRLTKKAKDPKRAESVLNRVHVSQPHGDGKSRPPIIPNSVLSKVPRPADRKTIKEIQEENGGAGVYEFPVQEHYQLEDPDWKYDNWPEFMNGKNVADFYDPHIEEKLAELEKEEEMFEKMDQEEIEASDSEEARMIAAWKQVRGSVKMKREARALKIKKKVHQHKFNESEIFPTLEAKGADVESLKQRSKTRRTLAELMGVKGKRAKGEDGMSVDGDEEMEVDMDEREKLRMQKIDYRKGRMEGSNPMEHSSKVHEETHDRLRKKIEKRLRKSVQVNEADRLIQTKKPKHLYSGKRGIGKTDRR